MFTEGATGLAPPYNVDDMKCSALCDEKWTTFDNKHTKIYVKIIAGDPCGTVYRFL
jgi:hypothetical protein